MTDAYSDFTNTMTDMATRMAEYYRLRPAKYQFYRHGDTVKWFDPNGEAMKGEIFHFKAFTAPATGTRVSKASVADTAEFPRAREDEFVDIGIKFDDLSVFQTLVKVTDLAEIKTKDPSMSVSKIVIDTVEQTEADQAARLNAAVYQSASCAMAKVVEKYDDDGSTYTSGRTQAYVRVDSGSIGLFQRGMMLNIRSGSTSTIRITCTVAAVNTHDDGPIWTGDRVADIGPGLILTYNAAEGTGTDTNFNNVVDNDEIVMSAESTTAGFHGFEDWFSEHTNVYKSSDGTTDLNRDDPAYHWSIPDILDYTSGGVPVNVDLETHFKPLAKILPYRVGMGRQARARDRGDLVMKDTLVAFGEPGLIVDASSSAADTGQFTSTIASSMTAAQRKELFGEVGFTGTVWHSPTLKAVALQADPLATPNTLTLVDPNSFFFLFGAGYRNPKWLDGGNWDRLVGTNHRPTLVKQAACMTIATLVCDQPGANAQIKGIKCSF